MGSRLPRNVRYRAQCTANESVAELIRTGDLIKHYKESMRVAAEVFTRRSGIISVVLWLEEALSWILFVLE